MHSKSWSLWFDLRQPLSQSHWSANLAAPPTRCTLCSTAVDPCHFVDPTRHIYPHPPFACSSQIRQHPPNFPAWRASRAWLPIDLKPCLRSRYYWIAFWPFRRDFAAKSHLWCVLKLKKKIKKCRVEVLGKVCKGFFKVEIYKKNMECGKLNQNKWMV